MAGTGPTDLHDLAQEFLDACAEALDTIPAYDAGLLPAPDRQFVSYGPVALDCCEQLAVHVAPITEAHSAPGLPKASFMRINHVALTVTASRCIPTIEALGRLPTPFEQDAAAQQINADKWALWNYLFALIRNGQLFDRCCDVIWGPLLPLQPNGGCGGSSLTITVCFGGYDVVQGT